MENGYRRKRWGLKLVLGHLLKVGVAEEEERNTELFRILTASRSFLVAGRAPPEKGLFALPVETGICQV